MVYIGKGKIELGFLPPTEGTPQDWTHSGPHFEGRIVFPMGLLGLLEVIQ